jgi:hypothetical protein
MSKVDYKGSGLIVGSVKGHIQFIEVIKEKNQYQLRPASSTYLYKRGDIKQIVRANRFRKNKELIIGTSQGLYFGGINDNREFKE